MSRMTPETVLSLAAFPNREMTSRRSRRASPNGPACSAVSGSESLSVTIARRIFSGFESFAAFSFVSLDDFALSSVLDFSSDLAFDSVSAFFSPSFLLFSELLASLCSAFPFLECSLSSFFFSASDFSFAFSFCSVLAFSLVAVASSSAASALGIAIRQLTSDPATIARKDFRQQNRDNKEAFIFVHSKNLGENCRIRSLTDAFACYRPFLPAGL